MLRINDQAPDFTAETSQVTAAGIREAELQDHRVERAR
jgi:hypothetical protein